ncbi:hypothetical protein EVAR_102740_1 [Eumeta japonica]|uniref:Uncharacterized protein n=1 Tax=Eumeta variegata TaxID=151549 RepID=A0A4C1THQ8_EUMVA|nr:hypothetical protein EVAR_102740_1 [Eumeta japonica]
MLIGAVPVPQKLLEQTVMELQSAKDSNFVFNRFQKGGGTGAVMAQRLRASPSNSKVLPGSILELRLAVGHDVVIVSNVIKSLREIVASYLNLQRNADHLICRSVDNLSCYPSRTAAADFNSSTEPDLNVVISDVYKTPTEDNNVGRVS